MTRNKKFLIIVLVMISLLIGLFLASLFIGSSNMPFIDTLKAFIFKGTDAQNRIIWRIRMPRILAGIVCGGGLALAGLVMQTVLNNEMASPSTLGVSNAAVFGANLSILIFSTGLSSSNALKDTIASANPYQTSLFAFFFAFLSIVVILLLSNIKAFNESTIVLIGVTMAAVWTALTTLIQYFAEDIGISQAVIWNIGDLSRATYKTDIILSIVVLISIVITTILSFKYNSLLLGLDQAISSGVNVKVIRIISLVITSLITACAVSFFGIISFVGLVAPHIVKRLFGYDHKKTIPITILCGSILLLFSDTLARSITNGTSLPVGVVMALIGAPFFLFLLFTKRGSIYHVKN